MKLLVTWSVAGAHKGFETWKKPFNPILGETWQAASSDGGGVTLFMEQVSHHPPVSAYELVGPGGAWKLSGWSQPAVAPVVKFYGIKTLAKGRRRFELPDGTRIDFYMPHYAIKGARRPVRALRLCCALLFARARCCFLGRKKFTARQLLDALLPPPPPHHNNTTPPQRHNNNNNTHRHHPRRRLRRAPARRGPRRAAHCRRRQRPRGGRREIGRAHV